MGRMKVRRAAWLAAGVSLSLLLLGGGCKKAIMDAINSPDIRLKVETTAMGQDGEYDLGQVSSIPVLVTCTIENVGLADLTLTGNPKVAVSGSAAFTVSQQPTSPIKPNASTTFTIRFAPGDTAEYQAAVSIPCNDPDKNPCYFSMVGQSTVAGPPEIHVKQGTTPIANGGSYPFGAVAVGKSSSKIFTIENLGSGELLLTGNPKVAVSGADALKFVVVGQPGSPVAASGSTTFTLIFTPGSVGDKTATVLIANNDSDEGSYAFEVTGSGAIGPTVEISSTAGDPTNVSPIPVTITFSEAVSGFAVVDIEVGNGVASNLQTSNNTVFTVNITPTSDGVVTVDVPSGVAQSVSTSQPNAEALQFSITSDRIKPTGSVVINGGATYTTTTSVTLALTANDGSGSGVTQMMVSNDSGFLGASWEAFLGSRGWTLLSGDGSKTVYAKLRDVAGNETPYSDSITLDATAPGAPGTPDLAAVDDTGLSNSDNITKNSSGLTFSGGGVEANTTITLYSNLSGQLGNTTADGGGIWSIDATLSETTHNVYARVTDAAGNTSPSSGNLSITVDLTGPADIPQILTPFQGQNTGADKAPTFRWLAVSGADYYDLQVDDSTSFTSLAIDQTWISETQYTPSADMAVSGSQPVGTRYYIRMQALDSAGNSSSWISQLRHVNVGRYDQDFNGDGYSDVIVGAYRNDADGNADSGEAYIFYGGASMNNSPDVTMAGEGATDYFGYSVSSAGDVNGDGYCDVIVGAYGYDPGRAYIFYGGASMNNSPDVIMAGEAAGDQFGSSVSSAGDVNGDGYCDVIVGAYSNDPGGKTNCGEAYIFYGGAPMNIIPDVTMAGEAEHDYFGVSVSFAGDVNGDGYSDIIVGAQLNDAGGNPASGEAYIFYGGASMNNSPDVTMAGEGATDYFGYSVSSAGDVNGDGYCDVIVGAYTNDTGGNADSGEAYIFYGGAPMNNIPDVSMPGEAVSDWFGWSVSSAGDVNGDGYCDVIVGARRNDAGGNVDSGEAYIFYGGASMNNSPDLTMAGEAADDFFGYSVSSAEDVNGDGYCDVIVGAYANDAVGSGAGEAYVFYGGASMNNSPDVTIPGEAAGDYFGCSVD